MPHFWNNTTILVVTAEELIPEYYSRLEVLQVAISRAAKRGYGIRKVQSGGNGRQLLIDYDSLPENIRLQLGDPRKPLHLMEPYYKTDSAAVDFYSTYKPAGKYIKPDAQEVYVTNASMLGALGRLKIAREQERLSKGGSLRGDKTGPFKSVWASLTSDCADFNPILKQKFGVMHTLPGDEGRLRNKFNEFFKDGYKILVNKNHGNVSAKIVNEELVSLWNNMFADAKPSYEELSRMYDGFLDGYVPVINERTGEIYDPKSFKKVSKSTIYNYLSAWENRIATHYKRSGDRQVFMGKYRPYHALTQPKFAGSIISIDDREPPFEYEKGKRIFFYNGVDLGSEAITCWVYGKTKEGIILDFYRQLIRNYHMWGFNLPAELECESSLNSSFKDTFLREGTMFQNVRIEANNARGKRCEGFWRQMRYGIEKKREGWIARPFAKSESNQKTAIKLPQIPYEELVDNCLADIETMNNMPHSQHPEMSRWQYFVSKQHPELKPTNYRAILPLLGYKTATSCKTGIIKLQGKEWLLGDNGQIYFGEKLINLMKQVEGQDVDILWLDANDGSIIKALVFHGDSLICEALPKPAYSRAKIEQTPADFANRELMSKYVATIDGYLNRSYKAIDKLTIIDNRSVTPFNDFKIQGRKRTAVSIMPEYDEVQEMAEPEDDDFETVSLIKSTSTLRDRF